MQGLLSSAPMEALSARAAARGATVASRPAVRAARPRCMAARAAVQTKFSTANSEKVRPWRRAAAACGTPLAIVTCTAGRRLPLARPGAAGRRGARAWRGQAFRVAPRRRQRQRRPLALG